MYCVVTDELNLVMAKTQMNLNVRSLKGQLHCT